MPTPRMPTAKAAVSGASAKNPQRFRDRKAPAKTRPIGEPYESMTDEQKAAWYDISREAPWLHSAHRTLLRLVCYHAARLHAGEEIGVSASSVFTTMLGKLGLTPTEESKVNHAPDGDEDGDDIFTRKSQ